MPLQALAVVDNYSNLSCRTLVLLYKIVGGGGVRLKIFITQHYISKTWAGQYS